MERRKAVYPGSFDPVTLGHVDLVRRGSLIFNELVVAVANNPRKESLFAIKERVSFVRRAVGGLPNVTVAEFDCLLVDFAKKIGAKVILKGLRAVSDFDYELQMSLTNRRLAGDVETVFMMAGEEYSFISSSVIKEIASLNGNVGDMVPEFVELALANKFARGKDKPAGKARSSRKK